ncbi:MAG TPA: hypothetical protein VMP41_03080 [Acidimicrobiales bacterium]|nr:hypothetical protein [Acidimicrobiales bacterium]
MAIGGTVRRRRWTQLDQGRVLAAAKTWVAERPAPIVATIAMFIPVMGYSLLGHGVPGGGHFRLITPGDLWGMSASSWFLAHGQFGHIYATPGALTSPPALEFVLAPILLFAQIVGLTAHFPGSSPLGLWMLLGPAALLIASPALFAIDAVARSWSLTDRTRLALALASACGVANVAGVWGHPEDCVAVAMVLWAALAIERRPDTGAGRAAWLLGIGIAFQPLAILGVAPVLARLGWRSFAKVSWRLVLPSLLVLVPPLIGQPGLTRFVLVNQPFLPKAVSFTPLTHLAPVIGPGTDGGGPTRLLALLLSAGLAIAVCRRRHDLPTVLTITAIAFFLRVLFETELIWYYMWPVAALCLVLSARRGGLNLGVCSAALVATIVVGNHNAVHNIALWWPALMASLAVMLGSTAGWVGHHQTSRMSGLEHRARGMGLRQMWPAGSPDV